MTGSPDPLISPIPLIPHGRVLVVDDVSASRELLRRLLVLQGYAVVEAASGDDALDAVAAHPPDVILLDVMMPGRDGFDTCASLKQRPATRLIPVVLVTALDARADRIRGIEAPTTFSPSLWTPRSWRPAFDRWCGSSASPTTSTRPKP